MKTAEQSICDECEETKQDNNDRKCHLCDSPTVNKYCINETCAEYE